MLTQERVRELFDYREDGELIWKVSRGGTRIGDVAGCLDKDGYRVTRINGKAYKNHRIVFLYHCGYLPENDTDHIDKNPGNNRVENLREVSRSCNAKNSKVRADNSSGIAGVGWCATRGTWYAQITVPGKQIHFGYFQDFTEAAATRLAVEQCLGWEGCHSSTSAYLYMQKYLEEIE